VRDYLHLQDQHAGTVAGVNNKGQRAAKSRTKLQLAGSLDCNNGIEIQWAELLHSCHKCPLLAHCRP
jgi:hypothetical protein